MKVGEALVEIVGDRTPLTQSLKQAQTETQSAAQKMKKALLPIGLAFTAIGTAGLKMIQSTKKINAQLGVTALSLGVTTKEMRDLTLATTNVTFPIDEVTASFDLLARAGVDNMEIMKSVATAYDTLGDATGYSASQVTGIMVPAMKTFRLSAEEMASKTDIMTYMVRNSTTSLDDFNTMVGYTDQEMIDAGLTIEDLAASMMYMSDNGIEPGKVMLREWNKAVAKSKDEGIALTEALGMTNDELATYKGNLEGATGMTQEYADVANKQYTLMDRLKQKWSELTLKASSFLEPLEPMLAGMTAMGPLMIALSSSAGTAAIKWGLHTASLIAHKIATVASAVAIKAVTVAQWLWNAAMTANPIGLIIIGIAALIAAGIALWKNWDKVTEFFKGAWKSIGNVVATVTDWISDRWNSMIEWFKGIPPKIGQAFATVKDFILAPFRAAWAGIESGINWLIRTMNKISFKIPDWIPGIGGKEFGINIPEVTLPKFDKGGLIPEPTLLYGLKSQRPYAIAGESGIETVVPGAGGSTVTNEFNIAQLVVREEADINRIAQELYRLQQGRARAMGV